MGASAAPSAVTVGASAPDDPTELSLNGLPQCEQNGAVRSSAEPHCWHRSMCNASTTLLKYCLALRALTHEWRDAWLSPEAFGAYRLSSSRLTGSVTCSRASRRIPSPG